MTTKQKAFWLTVLVVLFFPISIVIAALYAIYLTVYDLLEMQDWDQ